MSHLPTPAGTAPAAQSDRPALFNYGFIGSYPPGSVKGSAEKPHFDHTLQLLRDMAMPEEWTYTTTTTVKPFPILSNYLIHTFSRVQEENKICEREGLSCFNTGLVTNNQEEIFMLFRKNKTKDNWGFSSFCKESATELIKFDVLPERAVYFTDPAELIFDPRVPLRINIDHIIDDPNNFARFPSAIKVLSKHQLINTFNGAIDHAKKRLKRNYKTAIPQYYRGFVHTPQLQLLLPLCLTDPTRADLALAVYKSEHSYMGRTCLTLDMAINNARLIAKPDDEWLKP